MEKSLLGILQEILDGFLEGRDSLSLEKKKKEEKPW